MNQMKVKLSCGVCLAALMVFPVSAQTTGEEDSVFLGTLTLESATRTETAVSETSRSVSVVDSDTV